ncbi:TonB-dependent receptor domain-containing protein [Novosphingobium sp.]|uniref:TonB-dependent receptor domain-containing protein n=1 Tax=Novosphingobium sp. TaxID=1874826 RepID=UPI003B5285FE
MLIATPNRRAAALRESPSRLTAAITRSRRSIEYGRAIPCRPPIPAHSLNQKNWPLGIPRRFKQTSSRSSFPGNTLGVPAYLEGLLPQLNAPTINIDSQTIRLALDVTGNVGGWDVTGSLGMSHVRTHTQYLNFVNFDTLYTDLSATNAAGISTPAFNPLGGNSAAELARVAPAFEAVATDALYYAEFTGTRKIMDLPGGDLHLAVGVSFNDKVLNNPGAAPVLNGQIGGAFSAFAIGKQNDTAGYAELDATIFKTVDINVAGRDDYVNTYGNSFTPKAGITWRVVPPLLLRGTFSKGFRAPNPAEVGTAGSLFGLGAFADPLLCPNGAGGPFPAGTVPAACSSSPGYAQRTNALKPEKSTSFTAGAALTPFSGFSLTGDYYHINIKDQIVSAAELPSYSSSLGQLNGPCLRGPDNAISGVSTGAVNADGTPNTTTAVPLYGPIAACIAGYVNAASTSTSGFDLEARYRFAVGAARFTLSANYTHMLTYNLTAPSGITYKLAGTHGPDGVSGDTGNPRDHINASVGMDLGNFSGVISGYRIGSYSVVDPSAGIPDCASALGSAFMFIAQPIGAAQQSYCRVKSFTSINLALQYRVTPTFTWKLTVENLFDASAPIDAQTYGGSFTPYNPSLHEDGVIGRFFRLGVDAKF